jgi:quinol monooxygenase YgiN
MSAITVALLAQSIGYAVGFEAWTFRVIQLSAQLVAPLLLAWGLIEQVARGAAVRFGARLATAAVAAVAGVVLATDPLADVAFTKTWPSASTHYQIIPHYALTLVALVAGVTVLAALAVCAVRGRRVPADGPLVIGAAAVAVATLLLIALRFALPSPAYPALCAIAAAVVWVGLSRLGDRALGPAQADRAGKAGAAGLDRAAARAEVASEAEGTDGVKRSRGFRGDRGSRGGDDRGSRRGDDRGSREADDRGSRGGDDRRARRADDGLHDPLAARPPAADDFGSPDFPPVGQASDWRDDPRDRPGRDRPGSDRPGPDGHSFGRQSPDRQSPGRPGDRPRYQPDLLGSEPATGMFDASLPVLGDLPLPASLTTPQAQPGTDLAVPVTPPHGLIAIYTLLDDKVADFDRAADEVAEQVRAGEPDTLVYVIHTVPKAPMQRIFYEVYRDRAAYEQHEKQPYVQRFVATRRPYVLATNVIELRLKYAKVSPLPQAEAQAAQAQAAQSQAAQNQAAQNQAAQNQAAQARAQRPAGAPNLPAVRNGNGGRPSGPRPNGSRPSDGRQDTPDYPRRDPGYQPRDPGYQREPSYQPHQPSYQPPEPGYQPRDPGQPRREPSYQPADAGYQPRDPGYQPRDPGYQPRDPGYQPRDPGYYPRDPGDPGYPPREPRYTPREQDYPPYPSRSEYPSPGREYPSRDHGYPPPDPEYPSRGRAPEWSRGPRDPYAEPGDPYREPGDRYPRPRDQRDQRDQRDPRDPRDPREQRDPREPRDPYDPPAAPRYDRI